MTKRGFDGRVLGGSGSAMVLLATALGMGCGAAAAPVGHVHVPRAQPTLSARYSAALQDAIGRWEAEVDDAAHRWYPSYEQSYASFLEHAEPRLESHVREALWERGLTTGGLEEHARSHPAFVRQQNAVHRARMAQIRRTTYAIMGRIDGAHPSLEEPTIAERLSKPPAVAEEMCRPTRQGRSARRASPGAQRRGLAYCPPPRHAFSWMR